MLGGMERRLMLRMDISTLRLPELRNLLSTARAMAMQSRPVKAVVNGSEG